jgi:hypothetical protein
VCAREEALELGVFTSLQERALAGRKAQRRAGVDRFELEKSSPKPSFPFLQFAPFFAGLLDDSMNACRETAQEASP